jgi:hypothetical protein
MSTPGNNPPSPNRLDRVLADARRARESREQVSAPVSKRMA